MFGQLNITLVVAAATGAIAFGSAWAWQGARHTAKTAALEKQYAQAAWAAENKAREQERGFTQAINSAQAQAAQREADLRKQLGNQRPVVIRLRDTIASRVQESRDSPAACPDTSAVLAIALGECVERLTAVAADADRLRIQAQQLIDSWPRQ